MLLTKLAMLMKPKKVVVEMDKDVLTINGIELKMKEGNVYLNVN